MFWYQMLLCAILILCQYQNLISGDMSQPDQHKVIFRYRPDIRNRKSELVNRVREKNVRNVDYPSSRHAYPVRTAWLNGTSSYIHIDLQKNFDISAFEQRTAAGFTITAWIYPEFVNIFTPIFWIEKGFLLSIRDGALTGEAVMQTDSGAKERLKISTGSDLINAEEWIMVTFRDSLDRSNFPQITHHLELWINHEKKAEKQIHLQNSSFAVKKKIKGKDTVAGIGVYQIDKGKKRGPLRFFGGMVMRLEMKNYPADPKYLRLYTPEDLTYCFGLPHYLDRPLDAIAEIPEKRILSSFMPAVKPHCYIPFQNNSYIASGLAVLQDKRDKRYPYHIYLGLNWKDEQGQLNAGGRFPPIIAHLRPENGKFKVVRYFKLDGELRHETIAALAVVNLGMQQYLFVLSGERHSEHGKAYQTIGKYELRNTYRFDNSIWPHRFWQLPIYASKNDIMEGGQAWMKLQPHEGDSSALWIGTFAQRVNSSEVADSDSLGWLYKFLVSDNGNLMNPSTRKENLVSGTKIMYQKAWRMPTYSKRDREEQLSNINGGILIEENGKKFWILVEGFGEQTNFLRKYPFDEKTGFQHSIAYFPVPAGTREIDLLDPKNLISFSVSGCNYLQNEKAYYPWQKVCFPFIYTLPMDKFRSNLQQ